MASSWKGKAPIVEYLDLLTGEVQPKPTFGTRKLGKPQSIADPRWRQEPSTWIGRQGRCWICHRETFARFDGQWRCIPCAELEVLDCGCAVMLQVYDVVVADDPVASFDHRALLDLVESGWTDREACHALSLRHMMGYAAPGG